MGKGLLDIPEVEQKLEIARGLRQRAHELEMEAMEEHKKRLRQYIRKMEDKELNRTECLGYLSIKTLKGLKEWERKYRPYGYLEFNNNKILRSELLRFIDDKTSGEIARKMRPDPKPQNLQVRRARNKTSKYR